MRLTVKRSGLYFLLVLLVGTVALSSPVPLAQQTSDAALPELSRAEMENFLLTAKIVKQRSLSVGITGSERATLTDGRLTHDAHIQTVDVWKFSYTTSRGTELNFRDSYKYNIAAYRLDKLLDLRMVPVSVERKVGGKTAAVTWWVDDMLMMERDRFLKKIQPPELTSWNDQMYQVRAFNALIYNTDPNLGNVLITKDWKLWMVDFTRAFRLYKKLKDTKGLVRIDRRFYNGLRALTEDILTQELRPLLTNSEVKGLLARRDLLLEFFHREIAKRGEGAVICDMPGH